MESKETKQELKELFIAIQEFKGIGRNATLLREPVDIDTWLSEEYYSGPDAINLYPYWKNVIKEVIGSPELINEVILSGAIGTGKSTCANYLLMRKIYELSCYFPIQALYNLMSTKKIVGAYFNINKEVASQTGYGQLKTMIDSTPYFQKIFKRDEKINSIISWPKEGLYIKFASSSSDVLGMDLIMSILDEANFFHGDGVKGNSINDIVSKAQALYMDVRARGKSRFIVNNVDYTFNVLVSSSLYDSSFTAGRIKESLGDRHIKVYEPKLWEVKGSNYSKEKFLVFSGNELIEPLICNSVADVNLIRDHYKLDKSEAETPLEAIKDIVDYEIHKRFIEVPMDFRKEFNNNIIKALQDIAGVSIGATGKLFSNRESYANALTEEESPFIQEQIIVSTGSSIRVQDYFRSDWKPKDTSKVRFIHFDQSTTGDSYGIACCYIDNIVYDEMGIPDMTLGVDFMIRVNPPKPPNQIDLAAIRTLVPWLEKNKGIRFETISYDQFQSSEAIQDLRKSGYNVVLTSVEQDTPYLNLCELYYKGRIHHYRNMWYEKELFGLVWLRALHKVDHPPKKDGGTKDLSDALCGAINNALKSSGIEEVQREEDLSYFLDNSKASFYSSTERNDLLRGF